MFAIIMLIEKFLNAFLDVCYNYIELVLINRIILSLP